MQLEIRLFFFLFCVKSNFCPPGMWKCAFKRQLIFLSEASKFIMTDKCFTHKKVSISYNVIMPFTYVVATTFGSKLYKYSNFWNGAFHDVIVSFRASRVFHVSALVTSKSYLNLIPVKHSYAEIWHWKFQLGLIYYVRKELPCSINIY